ncbi:MAG: GNAT family N-acetyltransferase, partial [Pseudonocardiaceae bacterium]
SPSTTSPKVGRARSAPPRCASITTSAPRSSSLLGPEGRGRRLAREATLLTLDYGFHITNLRAVWLKVLERNTAAIRSYEQAGFKPVGRLRRSGYWLGAVCDELVMDALADEFVAESVAAA